MFRYMVSDGKLSNDIQGPLTKHSVPNESVSNKGDLQGPSTRPELKVNLRESVGFAGAPPPNNIWDALKSGWERFDKRLRHWSIGFLCFLAVGGSVIWFESKAKERAVDDIIENRITVQQSVESPVERNDLVEKIKNTFILGQGTEKAFGVILGPTGTGKTYVIVEAHRQSPKGSVYFEIDGMETFPKNLAKAAGMRIQPTILSVLFAYFFQSPFGYYPLPSDYIESIQEVIGVLAKRAVVFKKKHGHSPCLFIDGVDLLAKRNREAFIALVDLAKACANAGNLRIVFGCSEGHVMPLVHSTSSKTRVKVMEVLDLPEDKAVGYLREKGLPKDFADRVTKEIGCRMIFLVRVVSFYHEYKSQCSTDDDLLRMIKDHCQILFVDQGYREIVRRKPRSTIIIKHLLKFNSATGFHPTPFLDEFSDEARRKSMEEALQLLVGGNALRYTETGRVTWHSKMMEEKIKEIMEN